MTWLIIKGHPMTAARIGITVALVLLSAKGLAGQTSSGLGATRPALEARAAALEQTAQSTVAAQEAATIRQRLIEGDFRVGDRILLRVDGEAELSDTFTVGLGSILTLPIIGDVSLAGVLRSELQSFLRRRIGQNLRAPDVHARAYVRLSVQGAVARPGYYGVPAEGLLSDPIMAAGGTTGEAGLGSLRIERAGRPIWSGRSLQQAIAAGKTIDDAGLIAGDQYVVPRHGRASTAEVLRFGGFLLSIPVTIYTLTRIF